MLLHTRMLIGFLVGLGAGIIAHEFAAGSGWLLWLIQYVTDPVGKIFLRLLFMLVVPLVFSALVLGVTLADSLGSASSGSDLPVPRQRPRLRSYCSSLA